MNYVGCSALVLRCVAALDRQVRARRPPPNPCGLCPERFLAEPHLAEHITRTHGGEDRYGGARDREPESSKSGSVENPELGADSGASLSLRSREDDQPRVVPKQST